MTHPSPTAPDRPHDVWRVCGHDITYGEGSGCTCGANDPTKWAARRAVERLGQPATVVR